MLRGKKILFVLLHVVFWIINIWMSKCNCHTPVDYIKEQVGMAFTFYVNYFVLVPQFFRKNTTRGYLLWALCFFGMFWLLVAVVWKFAPELMKKHDLFYELGASTYVAFYFGGISTAFRLWYDLVVIEEDTRNLKLQKTNTQIQFMKSNVNIPFIVEALTHLEKKAFSEPLVVKEPLLQLSNVLRYGTYDATSETIEIEKEIGILEEYFALVNQMEARYTLKLLVINLKDTTPTVPNLMIKIVSYWRERLSGVLEGENLIRISGTKNGCRLTLPACRNLDVEDLLVNYPQINSSLFKTRYFYLEPTIIVDIISL